MLTKFRASLTLCTVLGLSGIASAENPGSTTDVIKDQDMLSDLTPYQRDRIQVMQGDTIWSIARVNRPASVTIEQMVLALYFSNPEAFAGQRISQLKAGSQLIVPPAILFTQVSPGDAKELLDKLRSGAVYDARKILRHFKHAGNTAALQSGRNTAKTLASSIEAGTVAPPADALKSTPAIEMHTLQQPSAPEETTRAAQPGQEEPVAVAPAPPKETAAAQSGPQVEQNTTAPQTGWQNAEKTIAAPVPGSAMEASAPAAAPAAATSPAPCSTEDCRMALPLDAEDRLIAIQNEIRQLNETLILQQQSHLTAARETANESHKNDVATPTTDTNILLNTWTSIKTLDWVTLATIAAAVVLFEMTVRALLRLILSLRQSIAAGTAPSSAAEKSQPPSEAPDQLDRRPAAVQNHEPAPVEPPPKRFETVIPSSADERSPPSVGKSEQKYTYATDKKEEYSAYDDSRQSIEAGQKPESYDEFENINSPIPKTAAVAKKSAQKNPISAIDQDGYMDDDLGLDFGLQDSKSHRKD